MNVGRQVFEFLKAGAVAHAKWDYEVSMSIVKDRKKMLIILSMLLPIFAVAICEGAGILGGKTAFARPITPPLSSWSPLPLVYAPG